MFAEHAYAFRHALMREAAYQLQLPRARARLHGLALQIIERDCGSDDAALAPQAFELCEHARLAQGAAGDKAAMRRAEARFLELAADHARSQGQPEFAARCWARLADLPGTPKARQAALLKQAGLVLNQTGFALPGLPLVERALEAYRALRDRTGEAHATDIRASILHSLGRMAEAEQAALESQRLAAEVGNAQLQAAALNTSSQVHKDTGRVNEAERELEQALELVRERGVGPAYHVWHSLGTIQLETGRLQRAKECARHALESSLAIGNKVGEGAALDLAASVEHLAGNLSEAEALYRRSIECHRRSGSLRNEGVALGNYADLLKVSRRVEAARDMVLRALAINREMGNRRSEGHMLMSLGNLAVELGLAEYESHYEQALAIFREMGDLRHEGILLGNLADAAMKHGEFAKAEALFHEALEIHRKMNNRRSESITIGNLGLLSLAMGRKEEAKVEIQRGMNMLRNMGDNILIATFKREWEALGGGALP